VHMCAHVFPDPGLRSYMWNAIGVTVSDTDIVSRGSMYTRGEALVSA
jgi:hypothetical protein